MALWSCRAAGLWGLEPNAGKVHEDEASVSLSIHMFCSGLLNLSLCLHKALKRNL